MTSKESFLGNLFIIFLWPALVVLFFIVASWNALFLEDIWNWSIHEVLGFKKITYIQAFLLWSFFIAIKGAGKNFQVSEEKQTPVWSLAIIYIPMIWAGMWLAMKFY